MKKLITNGIPYILLILVCACSEPPPNPLLHLDDQVPALTPAIFAQGIISKDNESEFGSVLSKDGREFFYGVDINGKAEIRFTQFENGQWAPPQTIISDAQYSYNDPFLSPDENRLYYISNQPRDVTDTLEDYDIWYSERTGPTWSSPINAGPAINSDDHEYYISFVADGSMYFASNRDTTRYSTHDFDIYKSAYIKGAFQTPKKLSDAINTRAYEADVFIAPDESYLIFCATRRSGLGRGDLYISFKDEQGQWQPAQNMGAPINTEHHELCPVVTPDGKYFFFTSNQDIYWVSTEIIENLKNINP